LGNSWERVCGTPTIAARPQKIYISTAQSGKQTGTAAPPVHQKPKHTDIISQPRAPLSLLLYPDPKLDSLALARE